MELVIFRTKYTATQTIGHAFLYDESGQILQTFATLEPQWNNNEVGNSCIPEGSYLVNKRVSVKFGNHFILNDTGKRSYILIHTGNFRENTRGCILLGLAHQHLNSDGDLDVTNSKSAMKILNNITPFKFDLLITSKNGFSKL